MSTPLASTVVTIGKLLRKLRAERDLTQQSLAVLAGVTVGTVARIEAGKAARSDSIQSLIRALSTTDPIEHRELEEIAKLTGVDFDLLLLAAVKGDRTRRQSLPDPYLAGDTEEERRQRRLNDVDDQFRELHQKVEDCVQEYGYPTVYAMFVNWQNTMASLEEERRRLAPYEQEKGASEPLRWRVHGAPVQREGNIIEQVIRDVDVLPEDQQEAALANQVTRLQTELRMLQAELDDRRKRG